MQIDYIIGEREIRIKLVIVHTRFLQNSKIVSNPAVYDSPFFISSLSSDIPVTQGIYISPPSLSSS